MRRTVISELSSLVEAVKNCDKTGNLEWKSKHSEVLRNILDNFLAHGSGIDDKWYLIMEKSNGTKVVLKNSFHVMDENGYYTHWVDFYAEVTPTFYDIPDIIITGKFGKNKDLKDYLAEVIEDSLITEIEINYDKEKDEISISRV